MVSAIFKTAVKALIQELTAKAIKDGIRPQSVEPRTETTGRVIARDGSVHMVVLD